MRLPSDFADRVNAFYREAGQYGEHEVLLRAGSVVAVVRDCRPALEDRWAELREVLGSDSELQLRLAVIAMRHLIARNRATLVEMFPEEVTVVAYRVRIADGVDLLA